MVSYGMKGILKYRMLFLFIGSLLEGNEEPVISDSTKCGNNWSHLERFLYFSVGDSS